MSQISRDDVARLAKLARLALTDSDIDGFAGQLDSILEYVSQIQAVDVTDVDSADHSGSGTASVNVTRPDEVVLGLSQEQVLAQAPAALEGRFAVPQILGEDHE